MLSTLDRGAGAALNMSGHNISITPYPTGEALAAPACEFSLPPAKGWIGRPSDLTG